MTCVNGFFFLFPLSNVVFLKVERKIDLVYGGGSVGLMGLVSQAVHDGGRHVLGFVPLHNQSSLSSFLGFIIFFSLLFFNHASVCQFSMKLVLKADIMGSNACLKQIRDLCPFLILFFFLSCEQK